MCEGSDSIVVRCSSQTVRGLRSYSLFAPVRYFCLGSDSFFCVSSSWAPAQRRLQLNVGSNSQLCRRTPAHNEWTNGKARPPATSGRMGWPACTQRVNVGLQTANAIPQRVNVGPQRVHAARITHQPATPDRLAGQTETLDFFEGTGVSEGGGYWMVQGRGNEASRRL